MTEEQEPKCNPHPDAPHGFDRNASHNAGRYVCECEGWQTARSTGAAIQFNLTDPSPPREIVRINYDGTTYWNGELVESNEEFKSAMIDLSKWFTGDTEDKNKRLIAELTNITEYFEFLAETDCDKLVVSRARKLLYEIEKGKQNQ